MRITSPPGARSSRLGACWSREGPAREGGFPHFDDKESPAMPSSIPPSLVERSILWSRLAEKAAASEPAPAPSTHRDSMDWSVPTASFGVNPPDRVGSTLRTVARTGRTVSAGGSLAAQVADFAGHPGTAEGLRRVARPAGKVGESFGAASNVWQAGKVLGDAGATSAQKMTAVNNAVFSTMIAAGTVFPVTCGPMVMAGTIGLIGTELINRFSPEQAPGPLRTVPLEA